MYFMLKLSFLLSFALGLHHCNDTMCPAPTDIYPCVCRSNSSLGIEVVCSKYSASDISVESLPNAFKTLSGKKIKILYLSAFDMNSAPSDLFDGLLDMDEVRFYGTNLGILPAFKGSGNTLQGLTFEGSFSERLTQNFTLSISHLTKLKSLTFTSNFHYNVQRKSYKTVSFGSDFFKNSPSSLEKVDLSLNQANWFGDLVFSDLPNLKEIYLGRNEIAEVYRSMFPDPAKHLLTINLEVNRLQSLPEDMFSRMPVLENVDVQLNSIRVLDERTWRPVWEQLENLKLGTGSYYDFLTCDSTISWTFKLKRPSYLVVRCGRTDESFEEYRERYLSKIIDEKQGSS